MHRQKINLQYAWIVGHDFEISMGSQKCFTLSLDNWIKLCVKKLPSLDSCFDYVCNKYYPLIIDSTIYEAFV